MAAIKRRNEICVKCSKCIYHWANGCPGLSRFDAEKCKSMSS